jgi:iron complex transport system substrate-binding protein
MCTRRFFPALAAAAVAMIFASCEKQQAANGQGAGPARTPTAERIVVLGVALAETVFDLGHGNQVVGVDESCTTVPEFASLPRVGYYRNFSVEGVLSLDPTLVIASSQSGPPAAMEQLRASGVRVVVIDESGGIAGIPEKIREVARAVGAEEEAVGRVVENFLSEMRSAPPEGAARAEVLFLMSPPGVGNWLAAGQGTMAEQVIEAAGGRNAVRDFEGYKPLSREALAALQPDVVILPTMSVSRAGGIEKIFDELGFTDGSAAREAALLEVDMAEFLSAGPRLGAGIRRLREQLSAKSEL